MDRFIIIEKIREIAEKVVENLALDLVHVEITGSGKKQTIRIFIDRKEGITHDDCSLVSQEIGKILDARDLVKNSYILEVSSPGIERGLYTIRDFEKFSGENIRLKTRVAINGQKNFQGQILGIAEQIVHLDDKTNGKVEIPFELITKANLKADFEKELKKAKRKP